MSSSSKLRVKESRTFEKKNQRCDLFSIVRSYLDYAKYYNPFSMRNDFCDKGKLEHILSGTRLLLNELFVVLSVSYLDRP